MTCLFKAERKKISKSFLKCTCIIKRSSSHSFVFIIVFLFFSTKEQEIDRHPEKRLKAAYTSFEEKMMPVIKEQNPTLRLSQLKQILRKEWMKSSENPLNQKLQNR